MRTRGTTSVSQRRPKSRLFGPGRASRAFLTAALLTLGCESLDVCLAETPWFIISASSNVRTVDARNASSSASFVDGLVNNTFSIAESRAGGGPGSIGEIAVWAVWTPVPEPGSALLVGLGLATLAVRRSKQ